MQEKLKQCELPLSASGTVISPSLFPPSSLQKFKIKHLHSCRKFQNQSSQQNTGQSMQTQCLHTLCVLKTSQLLKLSTVFEVYYPFLTTNSLKGCLPLLQFCTDGNKPVCTNQVSMILMITTPQWLLTWDSPPVS